MKKLLALFLIPAIAFAQPSGGHLNSTQDSISCLLSGSPVETDNSAPGTKGVVMGGIGQDGNFHRMFIGNQGEPLHYLYDGANGTFSVIAPINPSSTDAGLVVRNIFPQYGNGTTSSVNTPRFTISNDSTPIGSLTETAPATDTASSGLNGRLQRIAQRLTTLIGSTIAASIADGSDATLGAKADAKNTATDTTAVSIVSILKEISFMLQNPAALPANQSTNIAQVNGAAITSLDPVLDKTDKHIHIAFTASQTGATVLTPTSGKKYVVTDYTISCSSAGAGTITIFDNTNSSSTILDVVNCANNGGATHAMRKPYKPSAVNNVWKYTTGAGAAGDLTLHGYEE